MLKVKNVHKSFGENEILKGVDLTVHKPQSLPLFEAFVIMLGLLLCGWRRDASRDAHSGPPSRYHKGKRCEGGEWSWGS